MARAFLSHSSFDKDFVGKVYESLGAAKAVFDSKTFRKNCDLVEQIDHGIGDCEVYVLFSSKEALASGWVTSEMDLAREMRTRWKIGRFLVFQLDDTSWSDLPSWMSRYVVSCPPSPEHAALRILDELMGARRVSERFVGRQDDVRVISTEILDRENVPSFLYLSGPIGIGRRSLAEAAFKEIYPDIGSHKIRITIDAYDDLATLHRKLLRFSSNWRARQLVEESIRFEKLSSELKIIELARLLETVSVSFRQIVVLDVGSSILDEDGRPLAWFSSLLDVLSVADYPYVWVVSQRFMGGQKFPSGIFHAVQPLNDTNSKYLFKLLMNEFSISFPSLSERENIEQSIIGHPGLIHKVCNYLRVNPSYKPNKTHNGVVKLIAEQVESILKDFVSINPSCEEVVALFGETGILSYEDIEHISTQWLDFDKAIEALIDAGIVVSEGGEYYLASYLQRVARDFPVNNSDKILSARKLLFSRIESIGEEDFIPTNVLDSRIVEIIASGEPVRGYVRNLVMPSQQLKAARRCYDREDYEGSLRLAKECFEQSYKLSDKGKLEAWRLLGLSAIRRSDYNSFEYFESNLKNLPSGKQRDAIYAFARGFRSRYEGDLRNARMYFREIDFAGSADSHVYRELAYIYTFEGSFDEALSVVEKGLKLAPDNVYMLDMKAFAMLEKYKKSRDDRLLSQIDDCLDALKSADERSGANFYVVRASTRDVIAKKDFSSLSEVYRARSALPVMAKVSLLGLLSFQSKNDQFKSLLGELSKTRRVNKLADIEIARVEIEHAAVSGDISAASSLLKRFGKRFTEQCELDLQAFIRRNEGFQLRKDD